LPDFKGFTKAYNRANWFQPLYEGALSRKPLVVRIDEDDVRSLQGSGWQHKVRLAWHSICKSHTSTVSETKLEVPVTVAISTNALPLTVKDTEAYKAIMSKGSVGYILPENADMTNEAFYKLQDTLDKDLFTSKDAVATKSVIQNSDVANLTRILKVQFQGMQKAIVEKIIPDSQDVRVYTDESQFVLCAAMARFLWQSGLEMGIDVQSIFTELDEVSFFIGQHGRHEGEKIYHISSPSLTFMLGYLTKKV